MPKMLIDFEADETMAHLWCHGSHEATPQIDHRPARTTREVAEALGLSHTAVTKIEQKALAKCARWCIERGYRLEDLL